jgi:release factor glutamine methyltransferase
VGDAAITIGALRRAIAARLRDATQTPDLDARLLVAAAAGVAPVELPLRDEAAAGAAVVARADAYAAQRRAGMPVARILGRREFYGLDLALSDATLVPRPDTETLVDAALAFVADRKRAPLRVLDLGTGSGAILLALLANLPAAWGIGIDRAPEAAATARLNAVRLALADRAGFVAGNWLDAIDGTFDIVASNPPYIASGEIAGLPVEVRDHDPKMALDGGADGLAAVRAIIADLARVLAPGGAAFIEVGAGQAKAAGALAAANRFAVEARRDLAGIERVLVLTRDARRVALESPDAAPS